MKFQEERAKIDRVAEKMPDIIFIRELTGTLDLKMLYATKVFVSTSLCGEKCATLLSS